jgi:hypothetical protein
MVRPLSMTPRFTPTYSPGGTFALTRRKTKKNRKRQRKQRKQREAEKDRGSQKEVKYNGGVLSLAAKGRVERAIRANKRVLVSYVANLCAPFIEPRRKGMISEGGPGGLGARLLAILQKKKCSGAFWASHWQRRCAFSCLNRL